MNAYVQNLRLKYDPFADDYQRDDFYGGASRDNLTYTVLDQERRKVSLDAIVGPSGSGKTRLAFRLCECAPEGVLPVLVSVGLFTTAPDLLGDIMRELEISPAPDVSQGLKTLDEHNIALTQAGRSILLIIDNAHELGTDCARLVERLLANRWTALHLVLLGEDQLGEMLRAKLNARYLARMAVYEVPSLNRVETADYIHLKLNRAGFGRNLSMTSQAALDVLQQCEGLPGKINALTAKMLANQAHASAAHAARAARERSPGPASASGSGTPAPPPTQPAQPEHRPEFRYLLQAFALSIVLAVVVFWPMQAPDSSAPPTARTETQPIALPAPVSPAPTANSFAAAAAGQAGSAPGANADPMPTLTEFELLLLDTPADHFTVQLAGADSEEGVLAFIGDAQLGGVHGYYETRQGRNPWFVAVEGIYPDWEAAMEARSRLAVFFGENEPWIRRISNVHAEIARSGKRGGR